MTASSVHDPDTPGGNQGSKVQPVTSLRRSWRACFGVECEIPARFKGDSFGARRAWRLSCNKSVEGLFVRCICCESACPAATTTRRYLHSRNVGPKHAVDAPSRSTQLQPPLFRGRADSRVYVWYDINAFSSHLHSLSYISFRTPPLFKAHLEVSDFSDPRSAIAASLINTHDVPGDPRGFERFGAVPGSGWRGQEVRHGGRR